MEEIQVLGEMTCGAVALPPPPKKIENSTLICCFFVHPKKAKKNSGGTSSPSWCPLILAAVEEDEKRNVNKCGVKWVSRKGRILDVGWWWKPEMDNEDNRLMLLSGMRGCRSYRGGEMWRSRLKWMKKWGGVGGGHGISGCVYELNRSFLYLTKHVCATTWLLSEFAVHIINDCAFKKELNC